MQKNKKNYLKKILKKLFYKKESHLYKQERSIILTFKGQKNGFFI